MQMDTNDQMIAQRAETFRLSKAYEQAIEILEKLVEKYPDNAWVNAHLGATYCGVMDYGKAEYYLTEAIKNSNNYFWAHAQLGETYRLLAIANNRNKGDIERAIEHFGRALDAKKPEDSNYAWALAHLGATYRLKMTSDIRRLLSKNSIDNQSKEDALNCLNRALELMPTYAWAWGMRATVYRLAQEYEDSYWDLEVETVISPEIGVLQNSPSPVPFIETRRVNLHEHSLLSFYMTKRESEQKKDRHYGRAIAFAKQALIVEPNDLIAQLIFTVIETQQKKEQQGGSLKPQDIDNLNIKIAKLFEYGESEFSKICQKTLRILIKVKRVYIGDLVKICEEAGEQHKLTQLILKDVIEDPDKDVSQEPKLWLWKNYALTHACSIVLFLLGDLSFILGDKSDIGTPQPYRLLSQLINRYYTWERLYQTPVHTEEERSTVFHDLVGKFRFDSLYQEC